MPRRFNAPFRQSEVSAHASHDVVTLRRGAPTTRRAGAKRSCALSWPTRISATQPSRTGSARDATRPARRGRHGRLGRREGTVLVLIRCARAKAAQDQPAGIRPDLGSEETRIKPAPGVGPAPARRRRWSTPRAPPSRRPTRRARRRLRRRSPRRCYGMTRSRRCTVPPLRDLPAAYPCARHVEFCAPDCGKPDGARLDVRRCMPRPRTGAVSADPRRRWPRGTRQPGRLP